MFILYLKKKSWVGTLTGKPALWGGLATSLSQGEAFPGFVEKTPASTSGN